MNRRDFIKTGALSLTALAVGMPDALTAAPKEVRLTILHTNDTHSRIDPFPASAGRYAGYGGVAQRAAMVEAIRAKEAHVLLLDAGDIFQGTPYFNFFGGELEFKLMSQMRYDAATMGNHDFDAGIEGLVKQLPHAQFPFLVANYRFEHPVLRQQVTPFRIFRRGPLRIGVFGIGINPKGLVPDHLCAGTTYLDAVGVAKEMVQELRAQGCHLIVCLSHLGYSHLTDAISDTKLAAQVEGIDLLIGGHTHTFLEKPVSVEGPGGHQTLINQVGWAGIHLGQVTFTFSPGLRDKSATGSAHLVHPESASALRI